MLSSSAFNGLGGRLDSRYFEQAKSGLTTIKRVHSWSMIAGIATMRLENVSEFEAFTNRRIALLSSLCRKSFVQYKNLSIFYKIYITIILTRLKYKDPLRSIAFVISSGRDERILIIF